ncbi:MAG: hypothetical protein R8G01_13400 [Ilumatobacteraceae bacterium]|nr:hypothetical protein [Ilumatobacteraceae bacterium]
MTVHPFRPRTANPRPSADPTIADLDDDFPDDFHEDFATFDDADDSMRRFGSLDRQYRYAHRTVSPTVLAALTDIQVPVCQAFHCSFFGLLEDVGVLDGLIATPSLLVAGRPERVAAASSWLDGHPPLDVEAMIAAADSDEPAGDLDLRITETIKRHSLDLADATGANPSLTLGSVMALHDRVIDEFLDLVSSCRIDEVERLTDVAIDLLRRMPTSIRPLGGAVLVPLGPRCDSQITGVASRPDTARYPSVAYDEV